MNPTNDPSASAIAQLDPALEQRIKDWLARFSYDIDGAGTCYTAFLQAHCLLADLARLRAPREEK